MVPRLLFMVMLWLATPVTVLGDPEIAPCETIYHGPIVPGEDRCASFPILGEGQSGKSTLVVETLDEARHVVVNVRWTNHAEYSHILVQAVRDGAEFQGLPSALHMLQADHWIYGSTYVGRIHPGSGTLRFRMSRAELRRSFGPEARITVIRTKWVFANRFGVDGTRPPEGTLAQQPGDDPFIKDGEIWLAAGLVGRGLRICPDVVRLMIPDLRPEERMCAGLGPEWNEPDVLQRTVVRVDRRPRLAPGTTENVLSRLRLSSEIVNSESDTHIDVRWWGLQEDRLLVLLTGLDGYARLSPWLSLAAGAFAHKMHAGSGMIRVQINRHIFSQSGVRVPRVTVGVLRKISASLSGNQGGPIVAWRDLIPSDLSPEMWVFLAGSWDQDVWREINEPNAVPVMSFQGFGTLECWPPEFPPAPMLMEYSIEAP